MQNDTNNSVLFCAYYAQWVEIYKHGAIREATMAKYRRTQKWVEEMWDFCNFNSWIKAHMPRYCCLQEYQLPV